MAERLLQATEHLAGFAIVMIALCVLWVMTVIIGRMFGKKQEAPSTTRLEARQQTDPVPVKLSDELVAVYAAAAAMLDERHRIISVNARSSYWGAQGRRDIHASHRIR